MKHIKITIKGTTPLICNRFTDAAQLAASNGQKIAGNGDRGTPREIADQKLYRGHDGKTLIIPGPNFFSCIICAGSFFKSGKSKVTTQKSSLIPACVSIDDLEMPIKSKEGWSVDSRPVRIPSTGGRILAHRPIFHDWELTCALQLDTQMMTCNFLREIVDAAGARVGLGDFRPGCKGPYGKFVVTEWKESD